MEVTFQNEVVVYNEYLTLSHSHRTWVRGRRVSDVINFACNRAKEQPVRSRCSAMEAAKRRCEATLKRIESLPLSKITHSCKRTLLRLVSSELSFLSRVSHSSLPLSCNIGHIEAIIHILEQPCVTGISRLCKPVPISASSRDREYDGIQPKDVHVDIVCTLIRSPVWILVSDRNPRYITWNDSHESRGLKTRIGELLAAAESSQMLKPSSIILFFASGIENSVQVNLRQEFGFSELGLKLEPLHIGSVVSEELDDEWVNVHSRSYGNACILSVKVGQYPCASLFVHENAKERSRVLGEDVPVNLKQSNMGLSFQSLISQLKDYSIEVKGTGSPKAEIICGQDNLLNFDTTALVAIVSGISNGCAENLLNTPASLLRDRFKNNTEFVLSQAASELENPIHPELNGIIAGKRGIICETVYSEFTELVSLYAGPNEKLRANLLVNCIRIVPDSPSTRLMSLPTTRKLDSKNKVVFGTGDFWGSPTLTANLGFVRATSQTGMSLFTVEHRSRALVGD